MSDLAKNGYSGFFWSLDTNPRTKFRISVLRFEQCKVPCTKYVYGESLSVKLSLYDYW